MRRILSFIAPALVLAMNTGCSLAPDYKRPELDIPQTWEATQSQALQSKWWERFNDPTLNALVDEALASNKFTPKACISSATCCGISSMRSIVYHQAAGRCTLARDEIQGRNAPLMIYTTLRAAMIYQACGLDKQKQNTCR